MLRIAIIALVVLACIPLAGFLYYDRIANPRVEQTLREEPQGELARKVMLLTLPSGRTVPVNYLRKESMVWAGADGRWWKELEGDGFDVRVFIQGETFSGRARAVTDDPDRTKRIFAELRPKALPGFGTLVEIRLSGS